MFSYLITPITSEKHLISLSLSVSYWCVFSPLPNSMATRCCQACVWGLCNQRNAPWPILPHHLLDHHLLVVHDDLRVCALFFLAQQKLRLPTFGALGLCHNTLQLDWKIYNKPAYLQWIWHQLYELKRSCIAWSGPTHWPPWRQLCERISGLTSETGTPKSQCNVYDPDN